MSRDPLPRFLPLPARYRPGYSNRDEADNTRRALGLLLAGMAESTADDVVATYLASSERANVARVVRRARALRKRNGDIEDYHFFFERD